MCDSRAVAILLLIFILTQHLQEGQTQKIIDVSKTGRYHGDSQGVDVGHWDEDAGNNWQDDIETECDFNISEHSIRYFRSRLDKANPYFLHFRIEMYERGNRVHIDATPDAFKPDEWVWTFKTTRGLYPYLYWNIDFGLLSFGLLDTQTLNTKPFVRLNITGDCRGLKYGTYNTSRAIAEQLTFMTSKLKTNADANPKYEDSYYCFLAKAHDANKTLSYIAAQYLGYPINYINYNCCYTLFNYTTFKYAFSCSKTQMMKWKQCTIGPYFLGLIMFFYFPIFFLRFADWLSKDETITCNRFEQLHEMSNPLQSGGGTHKKDYSIMEEHINCSSDWIYLDGTSPRTFFDLIGDIWCNINKRYPKIWSRIRRFFCFLFLPFGVYVKLYMYSSFKDLDNLLKYGTPMGFLELLASKEHKNRVFVPALGGAEGLLLIYYILGIVLIVLPKSVKQLFEDGLPRSSYQETYFKSPLRFNVQEVQSLSKIHHKVGAGYQNAADLCISGIYMLFSSSFWKQTFKIQFYRIRFRNCSWACRLLIMFLIPFYIILCLVEICLCILVYGIPVISTVTFIVRGVMMSIVTVRRIESQRGCQLRSIFRSRFCLFILGYVLLFFVLAFSYAVCLIFLESFSFLSQILVFCFVAVIVFPSVAFGYLFFFIVLLYYIVRLVHDFGIKYVELLAEVVEISKGSEELLNHVTTYDGHLCISNVKIHSIKSIRVNNKVIPVPHNVLHSMTEDEKPSSRLRMKNNAYGVPTRLFDFIVERHCPVHQEIMRVLFQIALIMFLIFATMSITVSFASTPTSEISDVMHVIFIVSVGALPRVLEVAMSNSSESVRRDIERRNIEKSIVEFWRKQENDARDFEEV